MPSGWSIRLPGASQSGVRRQALRSLLDDRPPARGLAAFFAGYMLAAGFGMWMMVIPGIPITVWPPNGVVLAMLLTQPRQTWPWWIAIGALGELTGNVLWFHNPLSWAIGYVVANAAAVTAAALALTPYLRAPVRRLESLPQVLAFLAIAVIAAPAISATLGSTINAIVGKNPFTTSWPIWWLGDATGILIATPLAMSILNAWRDKAWPTVAQFVEGFAIALVLGALTAWELMTHAAFAFLLPLPVLWAALRFEFRGVAYTVFVLALAIAVHARGLPATEDLAVSVTVLHARLQGVLVVAATTGLIVAAIIRQQRQAVAELARANSELEARVDERTRAIEEAEQRFRATFQNAGVGIAIVSGDEVLMRANESLARMLGHRVEELEGRPLKDVTHPDDVALGNAAWDRLKAGTADEYELEKRYIGKDGGIVWGHTTVSCVRHPDGRIAYLIKIIQDITERKRSDETRQLLTREVNHRSKNLLTIVQIIARHTGAHSREDFIKSFGERLRALAANQDLLVNNDWQPVDLEDLVRSQTEHFGAIGDRIVLSGPPVMVSPSGAQALSLALHELATNAAKYGSLSNETGQVAIDWTVEGDSFRMRWRETGGPDVVAPGGTGFGSTVLDSMTSASMSGEVSIDFRPEGLTWELRCPMSSVFAGTEKSAAT